MQNVCDRHNTHPPMRDCTTLHNARANFLADMNKDAHKTCNCKSKSGHVRNMVNQFSFPLNHGFVIAHHLGKMS